MNSNLRTATFGSDTFSTAVPESRRFLSWDTDAELCGDWSACTPSYCADGFVCGVSGDATDACWDVQSCAVRPEPARLALSPGGTSETIVLTGILAAVTAGGSTAAIMDALDRATNALKGLTQVVNDSGDLPESLQTLYSDLEDF